MFFCPSFSDIVLDYQVLIGFSFYSLDYYTYILAKMIFDKIFDLAAGGVYFYFYNKIILKEVSINFFNARGKVRDPFRAGLRTDDLFARNYSNT